MRKIFFFLLALFFSLVSCLPPRLLPPEKPEPDFIINRLKIRDQKLRGLKGLAQVQIISPGSSFSTEHILFLRRPAWLRSESLSPLGTPQFYLVTDGEELRIYNPGENKYYFGAAKSPHLTNLLPGPRNLAEMVSFFLGSPPLIDYETALIHKSRKDSMWILELQNNHLRKRQLLWVDPIHFHVQQAELYEEDLIYNLIFSEFQQINQEFFPQKIQYTSPNYKVRVAYKEISLNPSWEKDDFFLPVPHGAQIFYLK